jgi:hypothetical protein
MKQPKLRDISYDRAEDPQSIRYRLAPIDVGFDLRLQGMPVTFARGDDPIRVSYAGRGGVLRVVSGAQDAVARHLRRHGYSVVAG